MENLNIVKQLKTIGRINSAIAKAETMDEAIKSGLNEIMNGLQVEYAVIWYQDQKGDQNLHPYYWIAPIDMTNKQHIPAKEIVGTVFASQKAIRLLDYPNQRDERTDSDYEGLEIGSMVCAPLTDNENNLGCIQFINTTSHAQMSEEDADVCEILCLLTATALAEKSKDLDFSWNNKEQIMRVRDIHRQFQNGDTVTHVLNGVNLDIYKGEFLVVLGQSGCGKSTFLNILGGLDRADSGSCIYGDEIISDYTQDQLTRYRRDNIGFVFQSYNLMSNLTAKQNLDLIGELVENPMDSLEALKLVKLEDKGDNYPSQLSGGQQQRVSIARALIKRPKIIFADEPTAALDYATSIEVLGVLKNVLKTGTTLVMVTHNEEIARMADRVVRMRNGRIHEVTINKHPAEAKELVW